MSIKILNAMAATALVFCPVFNVQAAWVVWMNDESTDSDEHFDSATAQAGGVTVSIDIMPDSEGNNINLISATEISVSIFTDNDFDALSIDPSSVHFGPAEGNAFRYRSEDSDGDGDRDLRLRFKLHETGIACNDTEADLMGMTFDGQQIATGTDSIQAVCDGNIE